MLKRLSGYVARIVDTSNRLLLRRREETLAAGGAEAGIDAPPPSPSYTVPQITRLELDLPCYEKRSVGELLTRKSHCAGEVSAVCLGEPDRLTKLLGLCRRYSLHIEVSVEQGELSSRVCLNECEKKEGE